MAYSVDPGQTAPIGAVCSGSTLFSSILNSSVMLDNICSRQLQQTLLSDAFFLGALRVDCVQFSAMDVPYCIMGVFYTIYVDPFQFN